MAATRQIKSTAGQVTGSAILPVLVVMEDTPVQSCDMAPKQAVSTERLPRTFSTGRVDARPTQARTDEVWKWLL